LFGLVFIKKNNQTKFFLKKKPKLNQNLFKPVWLGSFSFSVWLGFFRFGSVLAWFFVGLAWFFSVWVRFGFFQNFNRFNQFFFTVRFFQFFFLIFLVFSIFWFFYSTLIITQPLLSTLCCALFSFYLANNVSIFLVNRHIIDICRAVMWMKIALQQINRTINQVVHFFSKHLGKFWWKTKSRHLDFLGECSPSLSFLLEG
jgi:hypothetical protein